MKNLPKIDFKYWLMMITATTLGEIVGNLISRNLALGYTTGALIDISFYSITGLFIYFFNKQSFIFYWLLILIGNIAGTNLADFITLPPLPKDLFWGWLKPLELGTLKGSLLVMILLTLILLLWKRSSAQNGQSQKFNILNTSLYWLAILMSSTFGTTSGDFITNDTPLGAFGGSVFLLLLLAIIYLLFKNERLNKVLSYWLALVVIHPIGATIGNYISKPIGLNLGNVWTSLFLIIFFFLIYWSTTKKVKLS